MQDWRELFTERVEVPRSAEGGYLEVPFECPVGIAELEIAIDVHGPEGTVIDFGVLDPEGVRGWSGGARRETIVGAARATPGYRPGAPQAGRWAVLLGAYRIPAPGCEVVARIRSLPATPHWLRGELHVHTTHSDGADTPWQVADAIAALGLDFVALTDHNNATAARAFPVRPDVFAIPGLEWTTLQGHCNLLGSDRPLRDFRVADSRDALRGIEEAKAHGALVSVSHPFDDSCKGCAWGWGLDLPIDAVEIWNGPWRPCNQAALAWWQQELAGGRRLAAIGGSDRHAPHPFVRYGMPTNWVHSDMPTPEGVLAALRAGHVSLSVAPEGPLLDLRCGSFMQGDVVPAGGGRSLELAARARAGDRLRLYSERGLERETVLESPDLELAFPQDGRRFWRAELWRWFDEVRYELPAAISNPIYFAARA